MAAAVLLAVTTVSFDSAYGSGSRWASGLRAVSCCTDHCHKAGSSTGAARCCRVESDPDPAVVHTAIQAYPSEPTFAPGAAMAINPVPESMAAPGISPHGSPRGRAAPLFLLTRSLRI